MSLTHATPFGTVRAVRRRPRLRPEPLPEAGPSSRVSIHVEVVIDALGDEAVLQDVLHGVRDLVRRVQEAAGPGAVTARVGGWAAAEESLPAGDAHRDDAAWNGAIRAGGAPGSPVYPDGGWAAGIPGDLPIPVLPAAADDGTSVHLYPMSRRLVIGGQTVALSHMEFNLLAYLAARPGRVFSRSELLAHVWGQTTSGTRTVDVHVRRIRAKTGIERLIGTVPRVGYCLADGVRVDVLPYVPAASGR